MPDASEVEQQLAERLVDCRERQAGVAWPLPIHQRLDELVARANTKGAAANRKTLSAALILAATDDCDDLLQMILTYRTSTAGHALTDVPENAEVVPIRRHKPGPRTVS